MISSAPFDVIIKAISSQLNGIEISDDIQYLDEYVNDPNFISTYRDILFLDEPVLELHIFYFLCITNIIMKLSENWNNNDFLTIANIIFQYIERQSAYIKNSKPELFFHISNCFNKLLIKMRERSVSVDNIIKNNCQNISRYIDVYIEEYDYIYVSISLFLSIFKNNLELDQESKKLIFDVAVKITYHQIFLDNLHLALISIDIILFLSDQFINISQFSHFFNLAQDIKELNNNENNSNVMLLQEKIYEICKISILNISNKIQKIHPILSDESYISEVINLIQINLNDYFDPIKTYYITNYIINLGVYNTKISEDLLENFIDEYESFTVGFLSIDDFEEFPDQIILKILTNFIVFWRKNDSYIDHVKKVRAAFLSFILDSYNKNKNKFINIFLNSSPQECFPLQSLPFLYKNDFPVLVEIVQTEIINNINDIHKHFNSDNASIQYSLSLLFRIVIQIIKIQIVFEDSNNKTEMISSIFDNLNLEIAIKDENINSFDIYPIFHFFNDYLLYSLLLFFNFFSIINYDLITTIITDFDYEENVNIIFRVLKYVLNNFQGNQSLVDISINIMSHLFFKYEEKKIFFDIESLFINDTIEFDYYNNFISAITFYSLIYKTDCAPYNSFSAQFDLLRHDIEMKEFNQNNLQTFLILLSQLCGIIHSIIDNKNIDYCNITTKMQEIHEFIYPTCFHWILNYITNHIKLDHLDELHRITLLENILIFIYEIARFFKQKEPFITQIDAFNIFFAILQLLETIMSNIINFGNRFSSLYLKIACLLLSNKNIIFETFLIYNDNKYFNFISMILGTVQSFLTFQENDIVFSILKVVKTLIKKHFQVLITQFRDFYESIPNTLNKIKNLYLDDEIMQIEITENLLKINQHLLTILFDHYGKDSPEYLLVYLDLEEQTASLFDYFLKKEKNGYINQKIEKFISLFCDILAELIILDEVFIQNIMDLILSNCNTFQKFDFSKLFSDLQIISKNGSKIESYIIIKNIIIMYIKK